MLFVGALEEVDSLCRGVPGRKKCMCMTQCAPGSLRRGRWSQGPNGVNGRLRTYSNLECRKKINKVGNYLSCWGRGKRRGEKSSGVFLKRGHVPAGPGRKEQVL